MRRPSASHSGFSLVELMVVVGILAIIAGLAAPSFSAMVLNSRVRAGAEGVLTGLQFARAEAIRRNTNVSFVLGSGTGWTVRTVSPDAVIQTRGSREAGSNLNVTSTNGQTTVTFTPVGSVAGYNAGTALTRVTVAPGSTTTGVDNIQIDVFAGGQIRMCNTAVTTTDDPRKC